MWNAPQIFLEAKYFIRYWIVSLKWTSWKTKTNSHRCCQNDSYKMVQSWPNRSCSLIKVSYLRLCISVDPSCVYLCIWQMGSLKNVTVLFLHSNKLETLPEEMGDMQKLKVINFSDNKYVQTSYHTHVHNNLQHMLKHYLLISTNHLTFIQNDYLFQVILLNQISTLFWPKEMIFFFINVKPNKPTVDTLHVRNLSMTNVSNLATQLVAVRAITLTFFSENHLAHLAVIQQAGRYSSIFCSLCCIYQPWCTLYQTLSQFTVLLLDHVPFILFQHTIILTYFLCVVQ